MYRPNTRWTWAFILATLVQAIVVIALESFVFARFQIDSHYKTDGLSVARSIPTYLSLLIFGMLYELLLVYDALRMKNTIQVIGLCFYNLGILVYTAIEKDQIHDAVTTLANLQNNNQQPQIEPGFWNLVKGPLIAVPIVVGVTTVVMSLIAWKLYDEFAWTIYKQISADLRMKRRFLIYQIYIALLKFDFFFFVGFTVQFLVIVPKTKQLEFWLTIAALPITILILFLAAWAVQGETVWASVFVMLWYFAAMAYFMFKLVRMYASNQDRINDYLPARRTLTAFAVITVLLMVITIIMACWTMTNYDNGLKQYVHRGSRKRASGEINKYAMDNVDQGSLENYNNFSNIQKPPRMVID